MLREQFAGRNPTHFVGSSIVRAFITSEVFLWSSYNAIIPLLGIFVIESVPGGNIQLAAAGYSVHLITRVIFELISGKLFAKANDARKIYISISGILIVAVGTFCFGITNSISSFFISFIIVGVGLGIASPVKNSLFSIHLDKGKEAAEWGIYDALVFICIALSTALGGFLVSDYGFSVLFFIAGIWIAIGTIPYLLYLHRN
jgi:predicted MFS family arabinose efflux permease